MIFVYLDWNVFSQMRSGQHKGLIEILTQTDRFVTLYSTSHIGDIFSSYKDDPIQLENIQKDLEFISSLTNDRCLSNTGKKVKLSQIDPKRLLNQRIEEKYIFENFSLDKLEEIFELDPTIASFGKALVKGLKSLPLDNAFKSALADPQTADHLGIIFPGLRENPTMEGFFSSFGKMLTKMNQDEAYKDLRGTVQSSLKINRDKLFDIANPHESIDQAYQKLGVEDYSYNNQSNKYAPKWFNDISNDYLLLDMHGYQEDRIKVKKGRKETFTNTTEDAFHAGFGSTCNFYIINDKKAFKKTNKVYEKLKLNTLLFRPQEFVEHHNQFLKTRSYILDLLLPFEYLKLDNYAEEKLDTQILRTYYMPHFIFDFFNRMTVVANEEGIVGLLILSQFVPNNKEVTYHFEIEKLSSKMYHVLGDDINQLSKISQTELLQEHWQGRTWDSKDITFKLIRSQGIYYFYYEFKNK